MKRLLLIVLMAATMPAWGQAGEAPKVASAAQASSEQSPTVLVQGADAVDLEIRMSSQAGCPVQILNAAFERPGRFIPISQTKSVSHPTLFLDYRNSSGKDIESVVLTGWIQRKDSVYQLDSISRPFRLELSQSALLSIGVEATQALSLTGNAIGFDRIELTQVIYADGKTWSPGQRSCIYANTGASQRAKAW